MQTSNAYFEGNIKVIVTYKAAFYILHATPIRDVWSEIFAIYKYSKITWNEIGFIHGGVGCY